MKQDTPNYNLMVSRENINEINWDEVSEVQLTPAIVGGQ